MLNLNPTLSATNGPSPAPQTSASSQTSASDGSQNDSGFGKTLDTARKDSDKRDNSADQAPSEDARAQQTDGHREHHDKSKTDDPRETHTSKHGTAQTAEPAASAIPMQVITPVQERQDPAVTTGSPLPASAMPAPGVARAAMIETRDAAGTTAPASGKAHAKFEGLDAAASEPLTREAGAPAPEALAGNDTTHQLIDASRSALPMAGPMHLAPAQHTPAPLVHQLTVQTPPQSPQFAQDIGQHVVWLSNQQVQEARIQLHPRDLGPVHVNVQVHHDRVDVSFAAQHPDTVHALQQTLPQLDALLARQGLSLGQAQVGQQQSGNQGSQSPTSHTGSTAAGGEEQNGGTEGIAPAVTTHAMGLVDAFA